MRCAHEYEVLTTKISWRGKYQRLVCLTDSFLLTLNPSSRHETNRFPLANVHSAEQHGCEVLLEVSSCSCCGILKRHLRFLAITASRATALCAAVQARLTRVLSAQDSAAARELSAQSAVLSAIPLAPWRADAAPSSPTDGYGCGGGPIVFDVTVAVLKARGLPKPPPLCSAPVVECSWGCAAHLDCSRSNLPIIAAKAGALAQTRPLDMTSHLQSPARVPGTAPATADVVAPMHASPLVEVDDPGWEDDEVASLNAPVAFSTVEGDGEPSNPRWNYDACFRYRATDTELRSRKLQLRIVHRRWPLGVPIEFGHVSVPLVEIATGPHKFDLPVISSLGGHAGRIVFQVNMVQQCSVIIMLPEVACTMRALARHTSQASQEASHREASYSLSFTLTMGELESAPSRADFDPSSLKLDRAQVSLDLPQGDKADPRLALIARASAKALDQESFHLCVWEAHNIAPQTRQGRQGMSPARLLGEVWLPVTKVQQGMQPQACNEVANQSLFNEVLWLHGQRIGRLAGRVRITNGPKYVQLPSGFFTEMGILPIGPIAAGRASRDVPTPQGRQGAYVCDSMSPGQSSSTTVSSSSLSTSLSDFEQPPKWLKLPKEVELLVSLVQSLRKVVLELHLEPSASRTHGEVAGTSASTSALESASLRAINAPTANSLKQSASLSDLTKAETSGGEGARPTSRLANSEMAARRLTFIMNRLQVLLGLSAKESCLAFFYGSEASKQWTQRLMLRLWVYLISQVDSMAYRYQPAIFETLHLLMNRGELDCSAMFDGPSSLLERYKRALWETAAYVVSKLQRKAAPTEVRVFCSQALAITFFRLPAIRHELLITILPPGESRHKHVKEWNLPWSLHKYSIRESEFSAHMPLVASAQSDARGARGSAISRSARRMSLPSPRSPGGLLDARTNGSYDSAAVPVANGWEHKARTVRLSSVDTWSRPCGVSIKQGTPVGVSVDDRPIDQWTALWTSRGAHLSSADGRSEKMLGGRYWRERLRRRGHCFFLLLEHWVTALSMAMSLQPGESVQWQAVPGFPTLIKAFLIEMKERPLNLWPESMKSCLCALLKINPQLLQVAVRILLARTSSLHLRPALAVLSYLDTIFHSISDQPLPQTFSAEPLIHQLYLLAESEHFKVAASALIFLYTHLDALGEASRLDAMSWLRARFSLFSLHWSRVVRTIFFYIVIIKVLHYSPPGSHVQRTRASVSTGASLAASSPSRFCGDNREGMAASGSLRNSLSEPLDVLQREVVRESTRSKMDISGLLYVDPCGIPSRSRSGSHSSLHGSQNSLSALNLQHIELLVEFGRLRDNFDAAVHALEQLAHADANEAAITHAAVTLGLQQAVADTAEPYAMRTPVAKSSARVSSADYDSIGSVVWLDANGRRGTSSARSSNTADIRRARGCAMYAWAEYESVVKKHEAAETARAESLSLAPAAGVPRSASADALCSSAEAAGVPARTALRRSQSDTTILLPDALALSLSMISAHVHDDNDDDDKVHEEW